MVQTVPQLPFRALRHRRLKHALRIERLVEEIPSFVVPLTNYGPRRWLRMDSALWGELVVAMLWACHTVCLSFSSLQLPLRNRLLLMEWTNQRVARLPPENTLDTKFDNSSLNSQKQG